MQHPAQLDGPHSDCGRIHVPAIQDSEAAHARQASPSVPHASLDSEVTQFPSGSQQPVHVGPGPPHDGLDTLRSTESAESETGRTSRPIVPSSPISPSETNASTVPPSEMFNALPPPQEPSAAVPRKMACVNALVLRI
jgi:hypothetical protein